MQGRILKGIGGFYEVETQEGMITCKARGRFRKDGDTPMVGDLVETDKGLLMEILPRKNALIRPPVSNLDQLVIVLSASRPKPDLLLCDKLIISALYKGIRPLIVLSKLDEAQEETLTACQNDYGRFFPVLPLSAHANRGLDALREALGGKISCFAGQSAVGKSSLLNALIPEAGLEIGGLAKKTDRGRHTTRHAELLPYQGGYLVDTPGFSLFDPEELTQEDLDRCYPEFGSAPGNCRFAGCSHLSEPDCGVKALLKTGELSQGRYERYQTICESFIERRKHRYD